ncbi:NUDIX domain-containing protein [Streptomyces sp. NPDC055299]
MNEQTPQLAPALPPEGGQANASALIHDGAGAYLLHLRDEIPGIWEPGSWSLLGGGREPGDRSLEDTVRRELREEAGLDIPDLVPFVEEARSCDGTAVPIQIFAGQWNGDPATLPLTEGVMLHWFRPDVVPRLRMAPTTLDLIRRHAEASSAAHRTPRPRTARVATAGRSTVLNGIGVHLYLENADGEVLLGLRHPDSAYAGSTWHFLAGHCEQESALSCLVREAEQEAGLLIEPGDVELAHVVHLVDSPGGRPLMQVVFRAREWSGTPAVRDTGWGWWHPAELPAPIVPYTRAAIEGIRAGRLYTEMGWS